MSTGPLYGLTARSADQLRRLFADGGGVGGVARGATPARGSTWVKVTGAAVAGWYPGVVSLDAVGVWEDLTTAVKVAAADGSALSTGRRYLCTRAADDAGGVARFRAPAAAAALVYGEAHGPFVPDLSGTPGWQPTTVSVTLPAAGVYLVYARASGRAFVTAGAGQACYFMGRLYDVTGSAEVPNTNMVIVNPVVNNVQHSNSAALTTVVVAAAAKVIRLECLLGFAGTWAFGTFLLDPAEGGTVLGYTQIGGGLPAGGGITLNLD